MCTNDCNQGRACTCGTQSKLVNGVATLIWVSALLAVAGVLLGVL